MKTILWYKIHFKELFKELLPEKLFNKNKYWWHRSKGYLKQEQSWNTLFIPEKLPTTIRRIEIDVRRTLHFEEWLRYQIMKRAEFSPGRLGSNKHQQLRCAQGSSGLARTAVFHLLRGSQRDNKSAGGRLMVIFPPPLLPLLHPKIHLSAWNWVRISSLPSDRWDKCFTGPCV